MIGTLFMGSSLDSRNFSNAVCQLMIRRTNIYGSWLIYSFGKLLDVTLVGIIINCFNPQNVQNSWQLLTSLGTDLLFY